MDVEGGPSQDPADEPSRHGYTSAVTFFVVLCIVQLPFSVLSLSMIASFFAQGPAAVCLVTEAITKTLYDQGYELDQINRIEDEIYE